MRLACSCWPSEPTSTTRRRSSPPPSTVPPTIRLGVSDKVREFEQVSVTGTLGPLSTTGGGNGLPTDSDVGGADNDDDDKSASATDNGDNADVPVDKDGSAQVFGKVIPKEKGKGVARMSPGTWRHETQDPTGTKKRISGEADNEDDDSSKDSSNDSSDDDDSETHPPEGNATEDEPANQSTLGQPSDNNGTPTPPPVLDLSQDDEDAGDSKGNRSQPTTETTPTGATGSNESNVDGKRTAKDNTTSQHTESTGVPKGATATDSSGKPPVQDKTDQPLVQDKRPGSARPAERNRQSAPSQNIGHPKFVPASELSREQNTPTARAGANNDATAQTSDTHAAASVNEERKLPPRQLPVESPRGRQQDRTPFRNDAPRED